jgi:hypothetical protein
MAKATRQTQRKVTEETTVTLTLNANEAVTLALVLANIGGPRENSPRAHTQAVYEALSRAGVDYGRSTAYRLHTGETRFSAYPSGFKGETLRPEGTASFSAYLGMGL